MPVFNNLVIFNQHVPQNSEESIVPVLATSWSWDDSKTKLTFKLREGVKWHDGQSFTASDVAFTFKYLSDPGTSATTLGYYQDVASVEAAAPDTVKVTFKHPVAAWFNPFVGLPGQILPEHILRDAVGTGAKDAPFNLRRHA